MLVGKYDTSKNPAIPVFEVEISPEITKQATKESDHVRIELQMILDTAADMSVVPKAIIEELETILGRKLSYDQKEVKAFTGEVFIERCYDLGIHTKTDGFENINTMKFLITNDNKGLIGLDILNNYSICFDGPDLKWQVKMSFKDFLQRIFRIPFRSSGDII